jgi:DNA-directed RNA polymerase alpha subunit
MQRREFSFKVEDITICFVQLYNDCWICSLPSDTAERLGHKILGPDLPVDRLGVSRRIRNVFIAENITTVRELIQRTERDMMRIPNFSHVSLKQLKEQLAIFGFELKRPLPK